MPNLLKYNFKFYAFVLGFLTLNAHNFLDGLSYVKHFVVVSEFFALNLREI